MKSTVNTWASTCPLQLVTKLSCAFVFATVALSATWAKSPQGSYTDKPAKEDAYRKLCTRWTAQNAAMRAQLVQGKLDEAAKTATEIEAIIEPLKDQFDVASNDVGATLRLYAEVRTLASKSQDVKDRVVKAYALYEPATKQLENKEAGEAVATTITSQWLLDTTLGENSELAAMSRTALRSRYTGIALWKEAAQLCRKNAAYRVASGEKETAWYAAERTEEAWCEMETGELDKAEGILRESLLQLRKAAPRSIPHLRAQLVLARLNVLRNHFEEARDLALQVLADERAYDLSLDDRVFGLNTLTRVEIQFEKPDMAKAYVDRILNDEPHGGTMSFFLGVDINENLSAILRSQGKVEEAMEKGVEAQVQRLQMESWSKPILARISELEKQSAESAAAK